MGVFPGLGEYSMTSLPGSNGVPEWTPPADADGSVLIDVIRGDLVESRHRGVAAVVDAQGELIRGWGDIDRLTFPRSAFKPLQALPLVETGAVERFELTQAELALACASHNGEAAHVETVTRWLDRIGLDEHALDCGSHLPIHEASAHALLRAGEKPRTVHNNCSGKHTGMLTHTLHMGESPTGYLHPGHPAQVRIRQALEEMVGQPLAESPRGVDGCGAPQYGMSMRALALGMARMADPDRLPAKRKEAVLRIIAAITAEPYMIAGSGRFCTAVNQVTQGRVLAKAGAEGVYAVMIPERGWGLALKIDDGAARPRDVAVGAILRELGILGEGDWRELRSYVAPTTRNHAGVEVGAIRPGAGWLHP